MLAPITREEWTAKHAAHLLNRAGFGATPDEVARAETAGPHQAVLALLDFHQDYDPIPPPSWLSPESKARPDRRAVSKLTEKQQQEFRRERRRLEQERLEELRAWWLYRMRYAPKQLQEKLTLLWHGHFATSVQKVRSAYAMYQQNQTLRRHAAGNWRDLVLAVARDPAMLIYLDNANSRKAAPNENFARELMELFTLGEGHYSEEDIKASARAFTGWTLHREEFTFVHRRNFHDQGPKRFFNRTGNFDGEDIIDIIMQQPAAAEFVARKLWEFFAYDDPDRNILYELARTLRNERYELKPVLGRIFMSRAFYAPEAMRTQIKSPVQWLVGSARALDAPLPSGKACANALRLLGQELFAPPNVKGWDGGYTWITTATLLHRYNFAGALLKNSQRVGGVRNIAVVEVEKLLPPGQRGTTDELLEHLNWRLFAGGLRDTDLAAFRDFVAGWPAATEWTRSQVKDLLHAMMSTPQYQLT